MEREIQRKSDFELLRIIAILMIISYHYVVHGSININDISGGGKVFLEGVSLWGKAGVNIFCLIMGYYGISSDFRIKKVVKLEAQVLFYSVLGLCIAMLCRCNFSLGETVISIFPFTFGQYWYISAYFLVYILSPFINKMILGVSQSEYQKLVGISMLFWCIIPFFTLREDSGLFWNQFIWFIVMYIVGGYLRTYKTNFSKKFYWLVLCGSNIILIMSVLIINISSCYIPQMRYYSTYFRWSNSPIIIIVCVAMMRLAECGNIGNNKWINSVARGTLGVYLFHENIFLQKLLWNNVFNNSKYFNSYGMVLHFIIAVFLVFLVGNLIEIIRKLLFEKMDEIFTSLAYKIENIIGRIWVK